MIRLGRGELGSCRIQLQAHIVGIQLGQTGAFADPITHIHLPLADLATNAETQLGLIARPDFAGEHVLPHIGRQRLGNQRRAGNLVVVGVPIGTPLQSQKTGQQAREYGVTQHVSTLGHRSLPVCYTGEYSKFVKLNRPVLKI